MGKILYVWELGSGYGHIAAFKPIAQQLKLQGHEVIFALKNLEYADLLLGTDQFVFLQAPIRWPNPQANMPPANSYAGILNNSGFNDLNGLFSRVQAWLSLYRFVQPDLILIDHAPTALLAARTMAIPIALFGTGFFAPSLVSPLPSLRPWLRIADKDLLKTETEVFEIANSVLQKLDAKPLNFLCDLFQVDENFLCTFPELDPYQPRQEARYWGVSFYDSGGTEPRWPMIGDKKIFAYLNPAYPFLETILQQLRASSCSILIHMSGVTPAFIQKHCAANLQISPWPFHLLAVNQQADLIISHASSGTMVSGLLAGIPQLMLPMHLEQEVTARKVESLGAGICVHNETKKPGYRGLISELMAHPKYSLVAEEFSKKYTHYSQAGMAVEISKRCAELMRLSQTPVPTSP